MDSLINQHSLRFASFEYSWFNKFIQILQINVTKLWVLWQKGNSIFDIDFITKIDQFWDSHQSICTSTIK